MFRRLVLFNLLLLAIVTAGVIRLRRAAMTYSAEHQVSRIQPESEKPLPRAADVLVFPPKQEWTEIASRYPFSFDRNDVTLVVAPPEVQPPKRPKPILSGILLLGADRVAMLAPADAPKGSVRPIHIGEVVDGWTLVAIEEKSVTVRWDQTKESLVISDPAAPVARDYTKTNGGPGPSTPQVVSLSAAPPAAPAEPAAQKSAPTPPAAPSGRRVINTPFGTTTIDDTK